jgi:hypothetical protein
MAYLGTKPTDAVLETDDITDGVITTSKLADDSVTNPKLFTGSQQNFRNIIINGDMNISQRSTSTASITSDGYYTLDRFTTEIGSFGTWTQSQASDAPTGQGFTKCLKMDCTTAQGSPGSSAVMLVGQSIEGQMLQAIKQGTANAQSTTLSFWHKHTKTGTNIVELLDADNNNAVSGSYTQSVSDTWEKATITFPANTSGAYDNDNARSLRIRFIIGSGTDYTSGTLATTWQTSITNANRYAGQVNNADSTSNNFMITGVQYEVGQTASEFEFLPYDVNLRRCQRYFEICGAAFTGGVASSGTNVDGSLQYSVNKRSDNGQSYSLARTTSALANPGIIAINASSIASVQSFRTSIGAYLSINVDATTADRKVSTYYQNWLKVDDEL